MGHARLKGGVVEYLINYPDGIAPEGVEIVCSRCRKPQDRGEFYISRAIKSLRAGKRLVGRDVVCRTCSSRLNTAYRSERIAFIDKAKAGGCVDCGLVNLDHPEIFDFDHVQPGKVKAVARYLTSGTMEDLIAEIARCEVVCSNCHRIRTRARPSGKRGIDVGTVHA